MKSNRASILTFLLIVASLLFTSASTAAELRLETVDRLLDPGAEEFAAWRDPELVRETFFTENLGSVIQNGLGYSAELGVSPKIARPILVLENGLDDGVRHPITLSIGDGVDVWRNFIVGFGDAVHLYLSLEQALRDVQLAAGKVDSLDAAKGPTALQIRVLSAVPFEGALFDGDRAISVLDVLEPRTATAEKSTSIPDCCGPNMGFSTRAVTITAGNGISVTGYANMGVGPAQCYPRGGGYTECEARSSLLVNYPFGTVFHAPDFAINPGCRWRFSETSPPLCSISPYFQQHKTVNTTSPFCADENGDPTTQKHSWSNMAFVLDSPSRTGRITATSGCQTGATWTVKRAN